MSNIIGKIARLGGAAIASLVIAQSAAHAEEVVLATWGGFYEKIVTEIVNIPFTAATGIKVRVVPGNAQDNYAKLVAQKDKPQIDVMLTNHVWLARAYADGLSEAINPKEIPSIDNLATSSLDAYKAPDAPGQYTGGLMWGDGFVIAYRPDLVPFEIKKWSDLWDPRLKGKIAINSPRTSSAAFLLMINKIAGGTMENVDPGLEKIKELMPNVVAIADSPAQVVQMLTSGEAWAIPYNLSSLKAAVDKGANLKWVAPEEGVVMVGGGALLVRNAPHRDAALKYLDYWWSVQSVVGTSTKIGFTPMLKKDVMPASLDAGGFALTPAQIETSTVFDIETFSRNIDGWSDRWNREIVPLLGN
ncbi:MAG: extracellular solute-binding protein [Zavarzinia sp.]|nr:extracellular solute-binding protein [Zavarzinia sp.]